MIFPLGRYRSLFYIIKKYLKPFLWHQISVLLLQLLSISATIMVPIVSMKLIDQVFIIRNLSRLPYFLIVFVVLLTVKTLIDRGINKIVVSMSEILAYRIRKDIITRLHAYHYSFLNTVSKGDVIARFFTDVSLVEDIVSTIVLSIIIDILTIIGITFVLLKLRPEIFLIIVFTAPLYIFVSRKLRNDIHRSASDNRLDYGNTTKILQDELIFMKAIQELNVQHIFLQKVVGQVQKLLKSNLHLANKEIHASFLLQIIGNVGPILTFLYSSWITVIGSISIGTWTAVNSYISKIYEPLKRLLNLDLSMQKVLVSADRIHYLLESPSYVNRLIGRARTKVDRIYKIEFKDIYFKVNDEKTNKYVLRNCNFVINRNDVIAITGKSGIGKSTILNLIMGFIYPEKGLIIINDKIDLYDLNLIEWRNHIAFSHQFPVIFNNISLQENINLLGGDGEQYQIFSEGLNYQRCELSGGEQQKVSLSRVFNSNRDIILLDEPTISLDQGSVEILETFIRNEKTKKMRTIIFTCHKSPLLALADKIVFITNEGEVKFFQETFSYNSFPREFIELYENINIGFR